MPVLVTPVPLNLRTFTERETQMHARLAAICLTGTAVLALIASAASSSATPATTTWTVTPGGVTTGTTSAFTLTDAGTGGSVSCPDDIVWNPHHHGPNPYGSVTQLSLGSCTGAGQALTVTAGALPWEVNGTSYNPARGETSGNITGIHATVSGTACQATVDGTTAGADNGQVTYIYTNSTDQMTILTSGGNLHVYNVSGCGGLFRSGDTVTFSARYTMSPTQTITSP